MNISKELDKVFQTALSIICNDVDEGIACKDLFIAMCLTEECYASEVLCRLGINKETAKSFVMNSNTEKEVRYLSNEAEAAIKEAKILANDFGYTNLCSHHLLLAIIKKSNKKISQILVDYAITYNKIKEITEAMSHNGIGKIENTEVKGQIIKITSRIKDKKLENELLHTFLTKKKNDNK